MMQKDETSTQLTSHPDQNDIVSVCQVAVEQAKKSQPRQVEDNTRARRVSFPKEKTLQAPIEGIDKKSYSHISIHHHSSSERQSPQNTLHWYNISVIEIRSIGHDDSSCRHISV
jgi:hypothetical protein